MPVTEAFPSAARADLWRCGRLGDVGSTHAGSFHGRRPWHPASDSTPEMQIVQQKRIAANCQACFLLQKAAPEGALQA
jgi:hypothetical protein